MEFLGFSMEWARANRWEAPQTIGSGVLRVDPAQRRATLAGRDLELSPLLLQLLRALADQPRRLVTRQELKRALWPHSERIDTERRLNTAMRALRAALGDDADTPRFIETVRSHGYRWVAATSRSNRGTQGWIIPGAIAAVIALVLIAPSQQRGTTDIAAASAILKAQAAVEEWRASPSPALLSRASLDLDRAQRNAPASPALQVLNAQLALEAHWDWTSAEQYYAKAQKLDPDNADARLGLAWLRASRGERRQALQIAQDLLTGMILSSERRAELGWLLIRLDRPDLASTACPLTLARTMNALSCAHTASAALGDFAAARVASLKLMNLRGADRTLTARVGSLAAPQAYAVFLQWRARHFLPDDAPWFQRAQVLADAGLGSEALTSLEHSVAIREPLAFKIASTPSFAGLASDRRFQALIRRVGGTPTT